MKLAIVTLLVLALVGMVRSGGLCHKRKCEVKTVYLYPQCCAEKLHSLAVRFCYWSWHYCGRKRSNTEQRPTEVGFPCDFRKYDTNEDRSISLQEFTAVTELPKESAQSIFKDADKNDDGGITCDELMKSNLEFECKPKCYDETEDEF